MKNFEVRVSEILSKKINILAEDKKEVFRIIQNMYDNTSLTLHPDDIEKEEIIVDNGADIDPKYLERIDFIDGNLLVCELEDSKYFGYENAEYSLFDTGIIKRENDIVWISNIFFTEDCPNEDDNIIFYFKAVRGYGVLNYQKYKAKTIKEIFLLEKDFYTLYMNDKQCEDSEYYVVEEKIPFQELTASLLHEVHFMNKK